MSDKIETGGAAFPVAVPSDFQFVNEGMTLRDYFAAKALQGMLNSKAIAHLNEEYQANKAYKYADAMIATRGEK